MLPGQSRSTRAGTAAPGPAQWPSVHHVHIYSTALLMTKSVLTSLALPAALQHKSPSSYFTCPPRLSLTQRHVHAEVVPQSFVETVNLVMWVKQAEAQYNRHSWSSSAQLMQSSAPSSAVTLQKHGATPHHTCGSSGGDPRHTRICARICAWPPSDSSTISSQACGRAESSARTARQATTCQKNSQWLRSGCCGRPCNFRVRC